MRKCRTLRKYKLRTGVWNIYSAVGVQYITKPHAGKCSKYVTAAHCETTGWRMFQIRKRGRHKQRKEEEKNNDGRDNRQWWQRRAGQGKRTGARLSPIILSPSVTLRDALFTPFLDLQENWKPTCAVQSEASIEREFLEIMQRHWFCPKCSESMT